MKLYDIPEGSKIYGLEPNGDKDGVIIFDHLDGMYSYCYLEADTSKLVHLSAATPLVAFQDGYKIEDNTPPEEPEDGEPNL